MADFTNVQPKVGTGSVFLHNTNTTDAATRVGSLTEGKHLALDQQQGEWVTGRVYLAAALVTVLADNKSITPSQSSVNIRSINNVNDPSNIVGQLNPGQSLELIGPQDTWQVARVYVAASVVDVLAPGQQPSAPVGTAINRSDFANAPLVPARQLTPPASATSAQRLVANVWNNLGGLIDPLCRKIGTDNASAVAVISTESGGVGLSAAGRMTIRLEVHLFWSHWGQANAAVFNQLFQFDPTVLWKGHKYRPNSNSPWLDVHASQDSEYAALGVARSLNDRAALLSISMGLVQILGSNFAATGYTSVEDMFGSFSADERDQLIGFFNFVAHDPGKVGALQRKDYVAFGRSYNGPGQPEVYAGIVQKYVDAFNSLAAQL